MNKHTYIVQQLMQQLGLKYHQAVGAVGSMMQESGPNLDNNVYNTTGSGAFGIAQWLDTRKTDLINYASSKRASPNDFRLQVDFMIHELKGKEKAALNALKKTVNYKEATNVWTEKYERPGANEYHSAKRARYALQAHKMITGISQNKKQLNMPSISDNNSPAYQKAQNLSEAEKNKMIQQYKVKIRSLKKLPNSEQAIKEYNDSLWREGYIGYDEAGNWTGFIAEGVEKQMTANQKKAQILTQQKADALKAINTYLINNTKHHQSTSSVGRGGVVIPGSNYVSIDKNEKDLKAITDLVNKMGKDFSQDATVRKKLNEFYKKANSSDPLERKNALLEANKIYNEFSDVKVDFFRKEKDGSIVPGKDLDYRDGYMRVSSTAQNKGINFQDPKVSNSFVPDIPAPNFDPALKPEVDSIEGIDNTDLDSMDLDGADYEFSMPNIEKLNYKSAIPDTEKTDDQNNRKYNAEYTKQGNLASAKATAERKEMSEEQIAEQEKQKKIADSEQQFGMSTLSTANRWDADPSTFKSKLPIEQLASGAIGIALGKSMMEDDLPERDEELNNAYMAHIYESRRIAEMGMNPADEAAVKSAIAESYQIGLDNIINNSSGNRALILGNAANLDNINSKRMGDLAMADVQIKMKASEEYGRAMEYINNFNNTKSVANNERKYQRAVLRQAQGGAMLAGAFKSMSEALGSYDKPNSPENMYKIHAHVKNMGWSPLVKDDGEGTNKWSYSWYQQQVEKTEKANKEEEEILKKVYALPKEEREAFFERTSGMPRHTQYQLAKSMLGESDNTQGQTTIVDSNNNVVSQESTEQNGATVPINKTIVQNQDGSQTLATPLSTTTNDGTSASTPQSSGTKNTIFDTLKQEPIQIQNVKTSDGQNLNIKKDIRPATTFGLAMNNDENPASIYAETMGLDDVYNRTKEIGDFYNQFGEDENERNELIKNTLRNNYI